MRIVYNTCEIKVLQIYEDGKENGRCHYHLGTRLENMLWCLFKLVYTAGVMDTDRIKGHRLRQHYWLWPSFFKENAAVCVSLPIFFLWFLYHDYSLKVPWINALPFNHACRLGRLHKLNHKNEIPVISLSCHSIGNLECFLSIFPLQFCSCSLRIFLHKKMHFEFQSRRELNATQEQAPRHLS